MDESEFNSSPLVIYSPSHDSQIRAGFHEGVTELDGCPTRCPGCKHKNWSVSASEQQKFDWITNTLSRWQGVIEPLRGVQPPFRFNYRSKVCLHAEWNGSNWNFGLRVRKNNFDGKSDQRSEEKVQALCEKRNFFETEVIPIHKCPIQSRNIQKILIKLSQGLPSIERLPLVYLAVSGSLVTLVLKSSQVSIEWIESLVRDFEWSEWGIQGVWLNLNPSAGHRVFSSRGWRLIWGQKKGQENGVCYGPDSFQQLIDELHEDSLDEAKRFFLEDSSSQAACSRVSVMDLYSGVGRSLRVWESLGIPAVGVELSGDAIECLMMNVQESLILRGKVSQRIPQLNEWRINHSEYSLFVYVNPPRLGLESEVARWLGNEVRPQKIAYLSCSAGTLKRDLTLFTSVGYQIKRIIPYDFFPRTHHVETLVLLENPNQAVS